MNYFKQVVQGKWRPGGQVKVKENVVAVEAMALPSHEDIKCELSADQKNRLINVFSEYDGIFDLKKFIDTALEMVGSAMQSKVNFKMNNNDIIGSTKQE